MGRPKKRKIREGADQTGNCDNATNETPPSSTERDSPADVPMTTSGFEFDPQLVLDAGLDQPVWGYVNFRLCRPV